METETRRILVVDDQAEVGRAIRWSMRSHGYEVTTCTDASSALTAVTERGAELDTILLDRHLPSCDGLELLQKLRVLAPQLPIVMLTADDSARSATAAHRAGAFGYVTKPWDQDVLRGIIDSSTSYALLQRRALELERAMAASVAAKMVGNSERMRKLGMMIERVGASDVSVLVNGESGTGKELVARAIHESSTRRDKPFVAINCGAIPESLIDSELFGHVRGAFTGAHSERPGVFFEADGGTLFLDEIGEMPAAAQTRLLRVLQNGEVRSIGASTSEVVDVRVVAATHVDLADAVERKSFRADLYYRLNVVAVVAPPLRERREDIPQLATHFLALHGRSSDGAVARLTPAALAAMTEYAWPGNVRELENAILHGLALGSERIDLSALPSSVVGVEIRESAPERFSSAAETSLAERPWFEGVPFAEAKKIAQRRFEREYVAFCLERADGNIAAAARTAQLDRSNFRRVMSRSSSDEG